MLRKGWVRIVVVVFVLLLCAGGYLVYDFQKFCETSVPIFAYHRVGEQGDLYSVPSKEFKEQMRFLHDEGYTTMTLGEYAQARREKKVLYKKIVLTFDDGYSDTLTADVPIMKPFAYRGSVFLAIKFLSWPGYLDWHQMHGLVEAGWEIGSHTYNHIPLAKTPLPVVRKDLEDSYNYVAKEYSSPCGLTLSYPNGSFNKEVCKAVEEAGYKAAVTGLIGVNTDKTPLYELRRVNVFNNGKGLQGYERKLLRAYLISWAETHGIDFFKIWKKVRVG